MFALISLLRFQTYARVRTETDESNRTLDEKLLQLHRGNGLVLKKTDVELYDVFISCSKQQNKDISRKFL